MVDLPPVIKLLADIVFDGNDIDDFFNSVKNLIPEVRKQAEWSLENYEYISDKELQLKTKFAISPASGIDPFTHAGKCMEVDCRIEIAKNFSNTLGLYGEVIYLTDPFTVNFIYDDEVEWSDQALLNLANDILVLKTLYPLIQKDIIKFTSPLRGICSSCDNHLSEQISDFSDQFISDFWEQVETIYNPDYITLSTGNLHNPSMIYTKLYDPPLKKKKKMKKIARDFFGELVYEEVHSHLHKLYESSSLDSTIFSNSRAGLMSLKKLEGYNQSFANQVEWEKLRTAELPWINNLSPTQVLELRDSASKSLPQFRELMHQNIALAANQGLVDNETKCKDLVSEIRIQAEEVKSELAAINIDAEKRFHNTIGVSGIAISIFSSAIGSPALGLSTLIGTLGLVHKSLRDDHKEMDKLKSKPGYVLVQAEQLINTHNNT